MSKMLRGETQKHVFSSQGVLVDLKHSDTLAVRHISQGRGQQTMAQGPNSSQHLFLSGKLHWSPAPVIHVSAQCAAFLHTTVTEMTSVMLTVWPVCKKLKYLSSGSGKTGFPTPV